MTGLYVHVPFCQQKCAYCDFYSLPDRLRSLDSYIAAVLSEAQQYRGMSFETLFLGGGTPSLLGAKGLGKLAAGLHEIFDLSRLKEATTEANPESTDREFLETARDCGFNRLSLGVQSLDDSELANVGRIHDSRRAVEALELARETGFQNISADLILGLPGQDWSSLMVSLETLAGLEVQHLSVYCLALEPHTPLGRIPPPNLPDEDEQAELYREAVELLARRGFRHYEISNFALEGCECLHNLNYWRGGEYLGLGPAAASHFNGQRFKNKPDLDAYLAHPGGQVVEKEELGPARKAAEEAILRLRLLEEGLDIQVLGEKFGTDKALALLARLDQQVRAGSLTREGAVYRLCPDKVLVSNAVLSELLED